MLGHPYVGLIIRGYPFQAGEPPEVREAFEAALGLGGDQEEEAKPG
jgi:hypothetical protein